MDHAKQRQFISDVYSGQSRATGSKQRVAPAPRNAPRPSRSFSDFVDVAGRGMPRTDYSRPVFATPTKPQPKIQPKVRHTPPAQVYKQFTAANEFKKSNQAQPAVIIGVKPKQLKTKKSLKQRLKSTTVLVNSVVVLAVFMSSILAVMAYKYHVAVQRVEAQGAVSELPSEPESIPDGDADIESTSSLSEDAPASLAHSGATTMANSTPYTISIPKFRVSANIQGMGVTKNGAINVPSNIWQVGWYRTSATPKENAGVVLLNGHVHGPTKPGVFANLKNLNAGDQIIVGDVSGAKYTYQVVSKSSHKAGEDETIIYQSASPNKQGLNLVTCDGKIKDGKYEDRLVVFAERI